MARRFYGLGIILLAFAIGACREIAPSGTDGKKYKCPKSCRPPECFCPSASAPGGLARDETPQFVLLTFDDAIDPKAFDSIRRIQMPRNPNGCPMSATFFVTTDHTDYWLAEQLYAAGHEIAVHTMTHRTGLATDLKTWRAEITGARMALSDFAQIPREQIRGFRAPYLLHSDESFQSLWKAKFLYDSSITETPGRFSKDPSQWIWPYTLDHGAAQRCFVGICPKRNYPGLFEIPMWALMEKNGMKSIAMDPAGHDDDLPELYRRNFFNHYEGNRAPFGIFLHTQWLAEGTQRMESLNDFLKGASREPAVWFVSNSRLLDFMRHPASAGSLKDHPSFQCPAPLPGPEICDGRDNNGNGQIDEGLVRTCKYDEGTFRTCGECPVAWPSLRTARRHLKD